MAHATPYSRALTGEGAVLRYIQRTPQAQGIPLDQDRNIRPTLRPLDGQPVLVYGTHIKPAAGFDPANITLGGNPRQNLRATVQPYDPEGLKSPDEVAGPLAFDHINLLAEPDHINHYNRAAMATGHVAQYPNNSNPKNIAKREQHAMRVKQDHIPIASFYINESLAHIAQLPPDLQLQQIEALRADLAQLYQNQRMAWDRPVAVIADAINRADDAIEHGDLGKMLQALTIPHYLPPGP